MSQRQGLAALQLAWLRRATRAQLSLYIDRGEWGEYVRGGRPCDVRPRSTREDTVQRALYGANWRKKRAGQRP